MNPFFTIAILIGALLAILIFFAWLVLPFTISRLLKSIDERLYHQNLHLLENNRLLANLEQWLQYHNRQVPPPLP